MYFQSHLETKNTCVAVRGTFKFISDIFTSQYHHGGNMRHWWRRRFGRSTPAAVDSSHWRHSPYIRFCLIKAGSHTWAAYEDVPWNLLKYFTSREHTGAVYIVAVEHFQFPYIA